MDNIEMTFRCGLARRFRNVVLYATGAIPVSTAASIFRNDAAVGLLAQFEAPPSESKPRVRGHWANGNVAIEGIYKYLARTEQAGIGGVKNFDRSLSNREIVPQELVFHSPQWRAALRHALLKAKAKVREFSIAGCPRWSETRGSWVKPAEAMKKLV